MPCSHSYPIPTDSECQYPDSGLWLSARYIALLYTRNVCLLSIIHIQVFVGSTLISLDARTGPPLQARKRKQIGEPLSCGHHPLRCYVSRYILRYWARDYFGRTSYETPPPRTQLLKCSVRAGAPLPNVKYEPIPGYAVYHTGYYGYNVHLFVNDNPMPFTPTNSLHFGFDDTMVSGLFSRQTTLDRS